jgi:hypothetical protein
MSLLVEKVFWRYFGSVLESAKEAAFDTYDTGQRALQCERLEFYR